MDVGDGADSSEFAKQWIPIHQWHSTTSTYLVDPASSHMLVSKTKPCMSKYKQIILRDCGRLIISVIVYLMVDYYKDNRSNSRANTCKKPELLEQAYLLDIQTNRFGDLW